MASVILVSPPGTTLFTCTPPLCLALMYICGGVWFRRSPTASSSRVKISGRYSRGVAVLRRRWWVSGSSVGLSLSSRCQLGTIQPIIGGGG